MNHFASLFSDTIPSRFLLFPLLACLLNPVSAVAEGKLVAIGGRLERDNDKIYGALVEDLLRHDGSVVVVPTAQSGQTTESAVVDELNHRAGRPVAELVPIYRDTPEKADDPEILARLEAARGAYFLGGQQSRILNVFRPGGEDSPAMKALRAKLAAGGWVAGSSAGAAMMSDPMIRGGNSVNALRWADAGFKGSPGVRVVDGMGLFPYGITDQHFITRGRLGRLVVALEYAEVPRGYGVEENRGMLVDLESGVIEAVGGNRALTLVDISDMKREGSNRVGIRISLLSHGDTVDGASGRPSPADGKQPLQDPGEDGNENAIQDEHKPWDRFAVGNLIERLALEPVSSVAASDEETTVIFSRDERTRLYANGNDPAQTLTAIDVRMDILRK